MNKKAGNLYLFSVAHNGECKVIASTAKNVNNGSSMEDILSLPKSECVFIQGSFFENVSVPLVVVGEENGESVPIIILRNAIFKTSACLAVKADISCFAFFCEINDIILSPAACDLAASVGEREKTDPQAICLARDILALGSVLSFDAGLDDASNFDELVICIKNYIDIDISIKTFDSNILRVSDRGRVFLGGFCVISLLSMAIAAKMYSLDGMLNISARLCSGHIVIELSYTNAKKRIWNGAERLFDIAQAYGVALDVSVIEAQTRCLIIPEKEDEAFLGVKEDLVEIFELF